MTPQIARFMRPTWDPPGPIEPRWVPCWPHELCYQGHVCVSELGHQCAACSVPIHYLNQGSYIVHSTQRYIYQWNIILFSKVYIQEDALKMSSAKWRSFCLDLNVIKWHDKFISQQNKIRPNLCAYLMAHTTICYSKVLGQSSREWLLSSEKTLLRNKMNSTGFMGVGSLNVTFSNSVGTWGDAGRLITDRRIQCNAGLILGLHPANETWRYFVTTSLIGWAQA